MATIYVCDRCHTNHTSSEDVYHFRVEYEGSKYSGMNIIKADLCMRCMKGLEDFCKPLPRITKDS